MLVNIKFVNFPRPGGKYGNLKTVEGGTIMVPPDLLGLFRSGMSCEIGTKEQTWGQGTQDERLVTVATTGPLGGQNQPVQGAYGQARPGASSGSAPPYRRNTGFQPRVVQGGGGQLGKSPDQERMIFITGVVGRAMGSGKFTASEVPVLVQAAAEAFDRLTSPSSASTTSGPPDMEQGDPGPSEPM